MTVYRFNVGDLVVATDMGVSPGPYRVLRQLPDSGDGDICYRAINLASGQERALVERSIRIWTDREARGQ
jgi:hypothetical protein